MRKPFQLTIPPLTSTHGAGECTLFLTNNCTGKGNQCVGNDQTKKFYIAFIFCQCCNQCCIIPNGTKQKTAFCFQIPIQNQFHYHRQNQSHHKFPVNQGAIAHDCHNGTGSENSINAPFNCQVRTCNLKVDGEFANILKKILSDKIFIIVTHEMNKTELCNRIIKMEKGKIIYDEYK